MSSIRFLVCPQRTYDRIQKGEKKTFTNSLVNLEHLIQVLSNGKQSIDYDKDSVAIKDSFKYEIYFYTIKGEIRWYFDNEETANAWFKRFEDVYGVKLLDD